MKALTTTRRRLFSRIAILFLLTATFLGRIRHVADGHLHLGRADSERRCHRRRSVGSDRERGVSHARALERTAARGLIHRPARDRRARRRRRDWHREPA